MHARARQTLTARAPAARQRPPGAAPPPGADTTPPPTRTGELVLKYERRDGKTVSTYSRCSHPWYAFPPLYLDRTGCATTFLGNPSGGFVGGDTCSLRATLGRDAHVLFTTPSATRVYRSDTAPARQFIDVTVGPDAVMEWVPEPTIPFAGSRFEQRITVRLGTGASLLLRDAVAAGRVARGERWAFSLFSNRITITLADARSLEERYVLAPIKDNGCLTFDQGWNYAGSLFIVSEAVSRSTWTRTGEELASALDAHPERILGGVSETSVPGLAVKVVARTAPDLNAMLDRLWGVARMNIWHAAIPDLRRY